MLRGSGVDHDLRRDGEDRYTDMYDGYAFEVIVEQRRPLPARSRLPAGAASAVLGDCWHRFYVRMLEVMQSIDLVRQGIDRYSTAKGLFGATDQADRKAPQGRSLPRDRSPARPDGLLHRQPGGTAIPWRVRARSSSFCNLSVTHELCRGCLIADVPAIVGSLDVVMGEIDR